MNSLHGKTVLVMGGSTGIGLAIGQAFAAEGCQVTLASRHPGEPSPGLATRRCDVSQRAEVNALVQEVGAIDILVCSAGVNVPKRSFAEISPEDFDRILAINTTGTFNCLHAVLPGMRARRSGLVVNIVSQAALRPAELAGAAYCASKSAQSALGAFASLESGKEGVRVTNIYPGDVDTPLLDRRPNPPSAEHRVNIVKPEDIAALVLTIAQLPARTCVPYLVITPTFSPLV